MLLTQIESLPQTQRSLRTRLVMTSLLLLCLLELLAQVAAGAAQPSLEIFPKYFVLHPGEQIHYNVCPSEAVAQYLRGTLPRGEFHCIDAKFSTEDPKVLHLISPTTIKNGEKTTVDGVLEAVRPGRTKLVVPRSRRSSRSHTIPSRRSRRRSFCLLATRVSTASTLLLSPSPELTVLSQRRRRMACR